jgi:hypothetical protein
LHESVGYRSIVETFVTGENILNHYDIEERKISDYAISPHLLAKIRGETVMAWTQFYVAMEDGKEFCFGTSFLTEFFCMPEGFTAKHIAENAPAARDQLLPRDMVCRERPFFECHIEGL